VDLAEERGHRHVARYLHAAVGDWWQVPKAAHEDFFSLQHPTPIYFSEGCKRGAAQSLQACQSNYGSQRKEEPTGK
jgi:hypothetical protein